MAENLLSSLQEQVEKYLAEEDERETLYAIGMSKLTLQRLEQACSNARCTPIDTENPPPARQFMGIPVLKMRGIPDGEIRLYPNEIAFLLDQAKLTLENN